MARRRAKNRRKTGRAGARLLTGLLVVAFALAGGAAWLVLTPYGPSAETFVDLDPGSSTLTIGRALEKAGVVRSQYAFDLLRLFKRGTLRAGEYRFDHPATVTEVYARIARGDVYTVSLTIPEGSNIFDIAARVEQSGLGSRQDFLSAAVQQVSLIADIDPGARSLEGYLFPATYRFARSVKPEQIAGAMVKRFRAVAAQLGLKDNFHQVVTVASLVERETAVDSERPLMASVFENRLHKNMPLMTDPAVIYGLELEGIWRGTIYQSDLKRDTAYNTYIHAGLPPGPIANPGIPSLRAAMHPATTNYLYFVAAGANAQGRSVFAETLDEHNREVSNYRRAVKKAGGR
ncbi:MAG TPA: endolytic transglycosylase MltG [Terracidiphilus sp.]|nr:endolytic transglycosylase MltG [Terracidiphilus sp.]